MRAAKDPVSASRVHRACSALPREKEEEEEERSCLARLAKQALQEEERV